MPKHIDMTGERYGRLTVVEYRGNSQWLCVCDCGNKAIVSRGSLVNGFSTSCGCKRKEQHEMQMKKKDLTGTIHGHIEVLRKVGKSGGYSLYECKCNNCGKIVKLKTPQIMRNVSCGCVWAEYKERYKNRFAKKEESGDE